MPDPLQTTEARLTIAQTQLVRAAGGCGDERLRELIRAAIEAGKAAEARVGTLKLLALKVEG